MLRSRIQVYTDEVHATLYYLVERVFQLRLVHIVLILSYADALGVNLYQFSQRVHQSSAYTDGTANRYVFVGEFFSGSLRSRIDRRSVFADGKKGRGFKVFKDFRVVKVFQELYGFTAGSTVADSNRFYLIFLNHLLYSDSCLHTMGNWRMREDCFMVQQISLCI